MGDFQELKTIEGLSISAVSADLYGDGRDDLSLFYFLDGAKYYAVYTKSKIVSESIHWNLKIKNKFIKALLVNTKNANTFTGKQGMQGLKELSKSLAKHLTVKLAQAPEGVKEIIDPNRVKVVLDNKNNAIYFSREKIPAKKVKKKCIYFKQGNVFCFRKGAINYFVNLKPSNLEKIESVDMNRLVENRYKVRMIKTNFNTINVDNYNDLKRAIKSMKTDRYFKLYKK